MSLIFATQLTAVATLALAVLALTTAILGPVLLSVSRAPNWDDLADRVALSLHRCVRDKGAGRNVSPGANERDQERWAAGYR
jgi:hypothetical protein